ncbi:hypothetical protein EVAR_80969_1 [Eumeta japonica]|uniref:Reverse transcriptase domain-containing protein n=1 Tax=Eumeta variegata TaxID=151549 RepID=A0A4C1WNQ5_EUMVA|nr:hypothetical protein EVAR_80969_1 [Eumeta japonica]
MSNNFGKRTHSASPAAREGGGVTSKTELSREKSAMQSTPITKGVRQECVASPWLFNLFMDSCLIDLKEYECGLRMDKLSVKCLLYADDQVILAPSACRLQEMPNKMNDSVKKRHGQIESTYKPSIVDKFKIVLMLIIDKGPKNMCRLKTHPKKQLFSAPVCKFSIPSKLKLSKSESCATLACQRDCIDEFSTPLSVTKEKNIGAKAISMEDLTPTKRVKREHGGGLGVQSVVLEPKDNGFDPNHRQIAQPQTTPVWKAQSEIRLWEGIYLNSGRSCGWDYDPASFAANEQTGGGGAGGALHGRERVAPAPRRGALSPQNAGVPEKPFQMYLPVRHALPTVGCSEKLRLQVRALKALLESDNGKVRLAIREIDRLKRLLRDKEQERALLQKEKTALEEDLFIAEDVASEMKIEWQNTRNQLEGTRAAIEVCEHALALERAAAAEAQAQRDHAYTRLEAQEEELSQYSALLTAAEAERAEAAIGRDRAESAFIQASEKLMTEINFELSMTRLLSSNTTVGTRARIDLIYLGLSKPYALFQYFGVRAREDGAREYASLMARISLYAFEVETLKALVEQQRQELASANCQLDEARDKLEWWPRRVSK